MLHRAVHGRRGGAVPRHLHRPGEPASLGTLRPVARTTIEPLTRPAPNRWFQALLERWPLLGAAVPVRSACLAAPQRPGMTAEATRRPLAQCRSPRTETSCWTPAGSTRLAAPHAPTGHWLVSAAHVTSSSHPDGSAHCRGNCQSLLPCVHARSLAFFLLPTRNQRGKG